MYLCYCSSRYVKIKNSGLDWYKLSKISLPVRCCQAGTEERNCNVGKRRIIKKKLFHLEVAAYLNANKQAMADENLKRTN